MAVSISLSELAAVRYYSGSGYHEINGYLRGEKAGSADIMAQIAEIDRVVARSPVTTAFDVFRGISGDYADAIRAGGIFIGMEISESAFCSTSADPTIARLFSEMPPGGLLMKVRVSVGSNALDIAPYSAYPSEQEYVLPRDTTVRVTGFSSATQMIEAEVI